MRQIILDTETTGMNVVGLPHEGHRIIEIGAVEIIHRRLTKNTFHAYIKPDRQVDAEAFRIHGISNHFLQDKPTFSCIADELLIYIKDSELVMHNAAFDLGFINYEFSRLHRGIEKIEKICKITDSLSIARKLFPGKRNNLNALCTRYQIDRSKRTLHGALLDAEILAEVFLAMTGGQTTLTLSMQGENQNSLYGEITHRTARTSSNIHVLRATQEEIQEHRTRLNLIQKQHGLCLWDRKDVTQKL
ncbi:DNA polymerase III subunit epsilon [Candidatus Erwinia haradaeae]|uniref:DNA polymerase III subunit epsilon n=1 Tax=Candidatus Erwinia haradaeae TaxID=1922217 RepID=A0A451DDE9_9GAMM|nr:DNA polymerase III subunit epsilon [Candidatus Erwinia haradaeae]VFP84410.1 DNA polymerase III subunit epsilon [Candidatus Erwinia haradaeae]